MLRAARPSLVSGRSYSTSTRVYTPFINGQYAPAAGRTLHPITNPYNGEVVGQVSAATQEDLELATSSAQKGFHTMKNLPRHTRHAILTKAVALLTERKKQFADQLVEACGKPITQALGEVDRSIITLSLAADETRRFGGEYIPLDLDARAEGMTGLMQRFPVGPVSAITPFNFPLNLLVHKVAPAIAVGTASVVKPPPQCPQLAFQFAELLLEAGLPAEALHVLHIDVPHAEKLVTDERFKLMSFTGSAKVGWHLKSVSGKKKVVLELGGNAAAVVHEDAHDMAWLANRLAWGAFAFAGQVCIKVQRLFVHAPVYDSFVDAFVKASAALPVGDPNDPKTVVGPLIDAGSANRVEKWIKEASDLPGVRVLLPPKRVGQVISPTVLENVPQSAKVYCEEVFGPVAVVQKYEHWDEVLKEVNNSPYGLQAAVFTQNVRRIFKAFHELEVGGVIANDFPTLRIDNFPYGGVKDSGFGREGVRYAMEDMSEQRMLVINLNK